MNNIRELIIQRVFLKQLGLLGGLFAACPIGFFLSSACFFFFFFPDHVNEEAFVFSSGKK